MADKISIGTVAIIGVGLIGSSFARAARAAGIADKLIGFDTELVLSRA